MRTDLGRGGARGAGEVGAAAGLGSRAAAFALDYLPIAGYLVVLVALGAAVGWAFPDAVARAFGQAARAQAIGFGLVTLPVGLYFALSEASGWRATWGKRRLGLVVLGSGGARLGLGRSLARTAVKFVPWELAHGVVWGVALAGGELTVAHQVLLALTWLLVGANAVGIVVGRRAVYDVVVGTWVVRGGHRPAVARGVHRQGVGPRHHAHRAGGARRKRAGHRVVPFARLRAGGGEAPRDAVRRRVLRRAVDEPADGRGVVACPGSRAA